MNRKDKEAPDKSSKDLANSDSAVGQVLLDERGQRGAGNPWGKCDWGLPSSEDESELPGGVKNFPTRRGRWVMEEFIGMKGRMPSPRGGTRFD